MNDNIVRQTRERYRWWYALVDGMDRLWCERIMADHYRSQDSRPCWWTWRRLKEMTLLEWRSE